MKNNHDNTCDMPSKYTPVGFPSPAADFEEVVLNLHQYAVKNPAATYFVRASGNAMSGAGIFHGDVLVVDRSLQPQDHRIVIAAVEGELTVKRLRRIRGGYYLMSESPNDPPLPIKGDLMVWGVVTHALHHFLR